MHLGWGFIHRDNPGPTVDFRASLSQAEALLRKYKQSASNGQRQAQIPAKTPSRPITQRGTRDATDITAPGRTHTISELTPLDGPELGLALAPSTICPQSVAQIATFSQRQHGRPTQEAAEWRAEHQLAAAREASAAFAAAPGSRVHQPASQWQSFPATSGQWAPTTSGLSLGALAPLQLSTKRAVWASSMPPVAARPSSQPAAHRVSYKPADETSEHRAQESPSWEHCESGSRVQQEQPLGHPPGASEASLQELQSAISATKDLYAMLGEGQVVQLGSPASRQPPDSLYALLGGGIIAQADSSSDARSQDDSLMDSKLPAEPLLDRAVSVERAAAPAHPAQQWEQWEEQELYADLPAQHSVAVQAGTPHEASTQVAFDSSYQLLFDATVLQPCIVSQPTPTQSRPHPLQQLGLLQISAGPHAGSTQQAFSSTIGAELLGKGSVKQWLQDVQLQDLFRMQLECIRHQANKLRFQCSAGSTALARAAPSQSHHYESCSDIQQYIKATLPFPELA